jgi:Fe-S-cluster containining protein
MSDFRPLQKKAEDEFQDFYQKYKEAMNCSRGCSTCCIDELSIFSWEAAIITDWFFELSQDQKNLWRKKQALPARPVGESQENACAFLHEGQCTIYEARPTLCRTQGMAMQYLNDKKQVERDWCPLNFDEKESENPLGPPAPGDDLNLENLNKMLAQAQIIYDRENPEALGPVRVDLRDLRDYLLSC